jgi:hypothetical protein
MMKRREFITLLSGAAATWPLAARTQQAAQPRRVAVLMGTATSELGKSYLATFVQRLDQLGWINGGNARIETRCAKSPAIFQFRCPLRAHTARLHPLLGGSGSRSGECVQLLRRQARPSDCGAFGE